jgi:hypothetical protein
MRLPELRAGHAGRRRPEGFGSFEVETLVQVHAYPKARLVDLEETTEPRAEQPNHRRIGVRELDGTVAFDPSPAYSAVSATIARRGKKPAAMSYRGAGEVASHPSERVFARQ